MLPLLCLLIGLIVVAAVAHRVRQWLYGSSRTPVDESEDHTTVDTNEATDRSASSEACRGCAAESEACYADRMLGEHALDIIYYDDEELDCYKGTASNNYTPEQTEEFREVLCTMQPSEIADWLHSLQLRGIELPDALKDEAIMLMNEK